MEQICFIFSMLKTINLFFIIIKRLIRKWKNQNTLYNSDNNNNNNNNNISFTTKRNN